MCIRDSYQAGDRLGHRVGQQVVVETDAVLGALTGASASHTRRDDTAGNTDDGTVGGNILDDYRIGADADAFANADRAENLGAGTDDDAVGQRRVAPALAP